MLRGESRPEKHARIARRFMYSAEAYLQEGDIIQASEKLWGATAHAIKVYCISRGWRQGRYAHLQRAMGLLTGETGDASWTDGFKVTYRNHLNFYVDEKDAEDVERDRRRILILVNSLPTVSASGEGYTG